MYNLLFLPHLFSLPTIIISVDSRSAGVFPAFPPPCITCLCLHHGPPAAAAPLRSVTSASAATTARPRDQGIGSFQQSRRTDGIYPFPRHETEGWVEMEADKGLSSIHSKDHRSIWISPACFLPLGSFPAADPSLSRVNGTSRLRANGRDPAFVFEVGFCSMTAK